MTNQASNYKSMLQELQVLIADMQSEELDIDVAITNFEQGQKLLIQLKKYLESAENKILQSKLPKNSDTE